MKSLINTKRMGEGAFVIVQRLLLVLALAIIVLPVVWTVLTSFKERVAIFAMPPVWFFKPTLKNYIDAFTYKPILRTLFNSAIIAIGTTVISVGAGSMGAYAVARFRFRGSRELPLIILFGRMIPSITFVIPYFILTQRIGLLDTHFGVILSHLGFNLPFALLLLRSFFASIPRDLEQAAIIDGCTLWGSFIRIALPLAAPGIATTTIFCLLYSWNEFLFAMILTSTKAQTLPILAASFITPVGIEWAQIFSMVVITMSPMVVLGVLIRNHFVKGLTLGAVKG